MAKHWEGENASSVQALKLIVSPRLAFEDYTVGQCIEAKFQGRVYFSHIAKMGGEYGVSLV